MWGRGAMLRQGVVLEAFFSSAVFFLPEGLFSACIAEGVWIGAETSSSSLFVPAANGHAC